MTQHEVVRKIFYTDANDIIRVERVEHGQTLEAAEAIVRLSLHADAVKNRNSRTSKRQRGADRVADLMKQKRQELDEAIISGGSVWAAYHQISTAEELEIGPSVWAVIRTAPRSRIFHRFGIANCRLEELAVPLNHDEGDIAAAGLFAALGEYGRRARLLDQLSLLRNDLYAQLTNAEPTREHGVRVGELQDLMAQKRVWLLQYDEEVRDA